MVQAPTLLQYAPNMLTNLASQQQLPFQGALPAGSGAAIVTFAQLLGLIAVWKSLSMAWEISSTSASPYAQQNGSWGGVILMFIAGVLVFQLDRTMAMLAATVPGFPDLTSILSY
jgi:hypothetical protein